MIKPKNCILSFCLMLSACVLFVACTDDFILPEEESDISHTVIIWMGAENSLASMSISDLQEMHDAVDAIPQDCQVVVYRDAQFAPSVAGPGRTVPLQDIFHGHLEPRYRMVPISPTFHYR